MSTETQSLIALIVSFIAVTPVVLGWFRWAFSTLEIEGYGFVEIGFSNFGPTINMNGVLRAIRVNMFARRIYLDIYKESTGETIQLEMLFEQSRSLNATLSSTGELLSNPEQAASTKHAAGFDLPEIQSTNVSLFFVDLEIARSVVEDCFLPIQQTPNLIGDVLSNDFSDSTVRTAAAEFTRRNFWTEGRYKMSINVQTSRPTFLFSKSCRFEITEQEAAGFSENFSNYFRELSNSGPNAAYQFAYKKPEWEVNTTRDWRFWLRSNISATGGSV